MFPPFLIGSTRVQLLSVDETDARKWAVGGCTKVMKLMMLQCYWVIGKEGWTAEGEGYAVMKLE